MSADMLLSRRSYYHEPGIIPLLGVTIDAWFRRVVAKHADREAVVSVPQRVRLTYRDLDVAVQRVARGLLALGIQRGDRVGIWSTDNAEWILLQMATARVGAILVNINPAYRPHELSHALERSRLSVLVLIPRFKTSNYVGMIRGLCPELDTSAPDMLKPSLFPDLLRVVVYNPDRPETTERPAPGFTTWPELLALGENVPDDAVEARAETLDPDDPINIQFTSGTTGFPKPALLTHHNVLNNAYQLGAIMDFSAEDRLCVPVPFYHCFGMVLSNLLCLTRGATIVVPSPHFDPEAVLRTVTEERCTALHGVPTMFVAELERPDFADYDLSSLRTGIMGGAPCPPELVRRIIRDMHCAEILVAYGETEASPLTHITRPHDSFDRRVNTVGKNAPHVETKVVDPATGSIVPLGTPGEVCFRGYNVMRGYFGDPESTAEAIDAAGWLHSGDIGVMGAEGYLKITGRLKEMIIRGGENIYPAEIEAYYFSHPKIAEVAVFGLPDERMGEEIGMWVKLHEGAESDADELREYARGRIAHFKVPRYVWIVNEFPLTVTGKVQKYRMSEIAAGWIAEGHKAAC